MYARKIKCALSLILAVVMTIAMFTCCAFSVSAEDATTTPLYEGYTWSPMRGVTAVVGETTTTTETIDDMPIDEANALKATEYSVEKVENSDGTVTGIKVTTTNTVTANEDGTTATVVKNIKKVPTVIENPAVENGDVFKFGIYSDRENLKGYFYVSELNPFEIYPIGDYGGGFGIPGSGNVTLNSQHTIKLADGDNNVSKSFYMTMSQIEAMKDVVAFGVRQYNGMALSFVAPENGVYSASGLLSKVTNHATKYPYADDNVVFYVAKLDENGIEHSLSETAIIPIQGENSASIPNAKVELKKGEMLVIRTVNNTSFVGKVFVENFLVTKWDYVEAENKSTVTVNYDYQNHNELTINGEDFALSGSPCASLWDAKKARFDADTDDLVATTDFNQLYEDGNGLKKLWNDDGTFRTEGRNDVKCSSGIIFTADGNIKADVDYRYLTQDGTNTYYKYGLQFEFTVPEDGDVVLTGGRNNNTSGVLIERVGIKKAGSDTVEYGIYYNTDGGMEYKGARGIWNYSYVTSTAYYRTHKLGKLNAGDKIIYEISIDRKTAGTWDRVFLDTLNVAITTSNSIADFNGDFKADATDATYLRKVLLRKVEPVDRAMFNITGEDNVVDVRDLVRIKKLLAGEIVA